MKKISVLLVLAAGSLWGLMGLFVRTLTAWGFGSLQIASARLTVAAVTMLVFVLVFNRRLLIIRLRDVWLFLVLGIVCMLMMTILYFSAINMTSMSLAAILLYTAPIFVMIASVVFFRERVTWQKVVALALAFGGCVFISAGGNSGSISAAGVAVAIGSGVCYASYSVFGTVAMRKGYHPLTLTTYAFLFAALGSFVAASPVSTVAAVVATASVPLTLLTIAGMGILTAVLPFVLYTVGLRGLEPGFASILASVEPMVASVAGFVAYGERPGVVGIVMILLAVLLVNNFGIKPKQSVQASAPNITE